MNRYACIAALAVFPLLCCYAQEDSINISGINLRLGMSKSSIIGKLVEYQFAKRYATESDLESWCRKKSPNPSLDCPDFVLFEKDRIVSIGRNIGDIQGAEAARVVGDFYYTLEKLQKPG